MKNKFLILFLLLIILINNKTYADQFNIESSEIKILEKGNITEAKNGVKIYSSDGIEITSREAIYDKKKSILKIIGNVKINDKKNNIFTEGEEYTYYKDIEKIESKGKSRSNINNNYILESSNLIYLRNLLEVHSEKNTKIEDTKNNIFFAEKFKFNLKTNILKAKSLSLFDNLNNQYYLNFAVVDLKNNKFLGSDISIDFEDSLFGNNENNPRMKGNSIIADQDETKIYKGNFTTCNQEKDKCPPWSLYAEEVTHQKKNKRIVYKNAWLKVYDKPVFYFPRFFHPDPTVKRQSGFLMPSFQSSNNSGTSIQIPYYKVISENKDLTIYPRLFFDNKLLVQTEYRQANKDSDFLLDLSINRESNSTKSHFFADIKSNKKNNNLDFHFEKVSNDTYLKVNNIKSSIKSDSSALNSYINYSSFNEDSSLNIGLEVYEDLSKKKSDRYEFVLPNFDYEKNLFEQSNMNGDLEFNSNGYNKIYNTNTNETILVNNLLYSSYEKNSSSFNGLQTNYKLLLRNLNSSSKNSSNFKNGDDQKLLSTFLFESSLPLKKESNGIKNYLIPRLSARYSPNLTKNNSDKNNKITYENIFSLDRVDETAVEGGESLTLGVQYSSRDMMDKDLMNLSIASVLRLNENPDLPKLHGFSEKRSNFVGDLNLIPSKFFDINYKFSIDNDLNKSNYNLITTNININNLVTSFEYLEEDNYLSEDSYLKNTTKIRIDDNRSMKFETSKNLDQNITNYYNLIYQYENDCLTAALEYNKNYYKDNDLEPEENILFSIKIIPFGKISSPSITK